MCEACGRQSIGPISYAKLLTKRELGAEEQAALEQFMREWRDVLDGPQRDLVEAIEAGDIPLGRLDTLRAEVATTFGNYAAEFETTYVAGTAAGAEAGRVVAAQRFPIDISFDVPPRILDEFEDWSKEASDIAMETMTDDVATWIRTAHEEGMPIDEIAQGVNDDVFDGALKDWQAERTARTATISSSNAGQHSGFQDASSVVAEEWLTSVDGRQRPSHGAANGQIVAVDTTFVVGGSYARYPGDPQLPIGELANCRCSVAPVFRDDLTDEEFATIQAGGRLNT